MRVKSVFLIFSWALYDLANQFFALNVVSLYFVRWATLEKAAPEIYYSLAFGISIFFVAVFSPIWGGISDLTQRRKPFLVWLTLIAVVFTMLIGFSDSLLSGLLFFAIANFGCQLATVFYNAMLIDVAPRGRFGLVSGLGKMFGYSGAIIALYLIKPIVLKQGYQATFLPTGLLFLIFSLPCLIFIKDSGTPKKKLQIFASLQKGKIMNIIADLKRISFGRLGYPGLSNFLKASFFGLVSVNTIILFMSIYATRAFALNEAEIINLIAFSTFFAIIGSLFSGIISDYIGHKRALIGVFVLWVITFIWGSIERNPKVYPFIGGCVGFTLGSTWVVSRALAMNLVTREKIGEVFGLFNLVGYLSAMVGSLFWGLLLLLLRPLGEAGYRIALSSLSLFVLAGLFFLLKVEKRQDI